MTNDDNGVRYETPEFAYIFCLSCVCLNKFADAISICNRYCDLYVIYWKIRGTIWYLQGNKDHAKKDLTKFIDSSTDRFAIEEVLVLLNDL